MTEIYGLFDAADPMDPDRVYTSEAFARLFRAMMRDGIVHNDGAELAVSPTVPAAMSVSVGTGMALIQGRYYINDGDLTLNVEAADPSHPRIDRVVVRLEATPGRTVHAVVKKGTPAPSPVPPGLTRTAETWELSLAQVRVEAGATSIVAGKITDERGNTSLCGVAAPAYVPSSQVEVVGAMNMQGHALTGLPVPSAGTDAARKDMGGATLQNLGAPVNPNDAARKAYVDAKVAGFGISDITIDADKNWNGKEISNVIVNGTLKARRFTVTTGSETVMTIPNSENIMTSSSWCTYKKFKIPGIVGSASFTLSFRFVKSYSVAYLSWRILVDGVVKAGSPYGEQGSGYVRTAELTDITNNSVIELQCHTGDSSATYVTIDQITVIGKSEPVLDILPAYTVTDVAW